MKSIPASDWNALVRRLVRDRLLGCAVMERGAWRHPWQVTPAWDPERERWTASVHPGFVNGLDPEIRLPAEEAPAATLKRLGLDPGRPGDSRIDAWLAESPRLPLVQWRAIGAGAVPVELAVSGGERIESSYEPVPEFFRALGAAGAQRDFFNSASATSADTRRLAATEIVLRKDRPATGTDWSFGSGDDGTFAQFHVTYRWPPSGRTRATLRTTSRFEPPQRPDPVERILGNWEDDPFDDLHLATVYLLSPEDEPLASEPGPEWSPHVKHRVFWNLVHEVTFLPPPLPRESFTLVTGLAGGVADRTINQILATHNDAHNAALEFLANRLVEGRFWSI